jgi:hypothetical protein
MHTPVSPPPYCLLRRVRGRISHTALMLGTLAVILSPMRLGSGAWIDTDSDSINDAWQAEDGSGTITTLADLLSQGGDADYDGLPDDQEMSEGTDPFVSDTDYDGIQDGTEFGLP